MIPLLHPEYTSDFVVTLHRRHVNSRPRSRGHVRPFSTSAAANKSGLKHRRPIQILRTGAPVPPAPSGAHQDHHSKISGKDKVDPRYRGSLVFCPIGVVRFFRTGKMALQYVFPHGARRFFRTANEMQLCGQDYNLKPSSASKGRVKAVFECPRTIPGRFG